jgi:uncharacterized protein (DUF305 family)
MFDLRQRTSPMTTRRLAVLAAAATVLVACGSAESGSSATTEAPSPDSTTTATVVGEPATFNDADVEFAQGMIAHHEQAVEMSEIALDPTLAARAEVVDLATRIAGAQEPEIATMTAWLTAWEMPMVMDMSDGHDMSAMDGMMTAEEMEALATLTGADFDVAWMQMMVEHHEGAISQAETVLSAGSDPEVLALAERIIAAQQGEIDERNALLAG